MPNKPKAVFLFFMAFLSCSLSLGAVWIGLKDYAQNTQTTEQPEPITVAAISRRGIDGNRHVLVSEGKLGTEPAIDTSTFFNRTTKRWVTTRRAYYPLFSRAEDEKLPIPLVVQVNLGESEQVPALQPDFNVRGMIENGKGFGQLADGLHHIPPGVCEELAKIYPGFRCTLAIQINAGEAPIGDNWIILVSAGMFVVFLFGALLPLKGGMDAWRGIEPKTKQEAAAAAPKEDLANSPENT